MTEESRDLAGSWLRKAKSDLASAHRLADGEQPPLDTAACHCQQAAEKALKGWLSLQETPFPKTHLVDELLDLCVQRSADFEALRDHCQTLTPPWPPSSATPVRFSNPRERSSRWPERWPTKWFASWRNE